MEGATTPLTLFPFRERERERERELGFEYYINVGLPGYWVGESLIGSLTVPAQITNNSEG
jgi:hypothetical protein